MMRFEASHHQLLSMIWFERYHYGGTTEADLTASGKDERKADFSGQHTCISDASLG
jgi:hypothetical protein